MRGRSFVVAAGLLFIAQQKPVRVAFLSGDTQSAAAVAAVRELARDPELRGVEIRVMPDQGLDEADRRFIRDADLIIVETHIPATVRSIADDVRAAVRRGVRAHAVGALFEPEYAQVGLRHDDELSVYFEAGGRHNIAQMLRRALGRSLRPGLTAEAAVPFPEVGYIDLRTERAYTSYDAYAADYLRASPARRERPWIGMFINRGSATSGQLAPLLAMAEALEARGFNVLPAFGYPAEREIAGLFLGPDSSGRVSAIVAYGLKLGVVPDAIAPVLKELDVPLLNAIILYSQTREQWEASSAGVDLVERSWQVGGAEMSGVIAPTVVASKEVVVDPTTGLRYVTSRAIPDRVNRMADRVARWAHLRRAPNAEKRVAIIYYNYPPGQPSIGASYLNVLPESMWQILERMRREGYDVREAPQSPEELFTMVRAFGVNAPAGDTMEVARLARSGRVPLVAMAEYERWFAALPTDFRRSVVSRWGNPASSRVMTWRDGAGKTFLVLPGLRFGNVWLMVQPSRGWEQDPMRAYHDVHLPMHHQYLAFYLWLQHGARVNAMVHLGTHGTHEWQSGKEVGYTSSDPGEILITDVPQLYPYIVDNIGEGQQAKRRGLATIISHLTPPLDKASLQPALRDLQAQISDYHVSREKGSVALRDQAVRITAAARQRGLLHHLEIHDLPDSAVLEAQQIQTLEHHLKHMGSSFTTFGLHTFGVAYADSMVEATTEAILSVEADLADSVRTARKAELAAALRASAPAELASLMAGLSGRYVPAGPGNDPMRSPAALPTGRNFYGFDPTRVPTSATYAAGERLADSLLAQHRARHDGRSPRRLLFNLWGTETNRHEGAIEGEILALMGVRPVWDQRGRVSGVALIPRDSLGRPRVDVTIVPSGLYRDLFPNVMRVLDSAVTLVKSSPEPDNPMRAHIAEATEALRARGLSDREAARVATVRIFGEAPGAYGIGLETVVRADSTWKNERDVAAVYYRKIGHLYGQGFWGAKTMGGDASKSLGEDVLKLALRGVDGVIHSRSTTTYGTIDNDDVYQYLGGAAMAVRDVNGKTPDVLVADLSNPRQARTVTLKRFMGEELETRYLSPKWVRAMLDEGYAGTQLVTQLTDNLWGWQVTVPEAVDASAWQGMYDMYVADVHELGVRDAMERARNLAGFQSMVSRMLVAVDRGYWKPAPETVEQLRSAQGQLAAAVVIESRTAAEEGKRVAAGLDPAPGPRAASVAPAPNAAAPPTPALSAPVPPLVRGRVVEEVRRTESAVARSSAPSVQLAAVVITMLLLMLGGWWREARRA